MSKDIIDSAGRSVKMPAATGSEPLAVYICDLRDKSHVQEILQ